ncbi:unnamed protein product [Calicophoron daubneyi]|uniref:G-protein coupled receptors family 1 profile domain-containing protein n=1 Tax=Calicophoron daubneyi TaxID=300641 RepID=A0AAV2SWH1_CALDB
MNPSPHSICDVVLQDSVLSSWLELNDTELTDKFTEAFGNVTDPQNIRKQIESQLTIKDLTDYLLTCQTVYFIFRFVPPIILLIGTIGNILSFVVLCRRSKFYTSTYIHLTALALVDEGVLCFGLLIRWTDRLTGKHLTDTHWILCKLVNFIGVTTSCTSVWIIVTVTIERALVIMLPLSSNPHNRLKRSKIVLCCLALVMCLFTCHFFATVDLVTTYPDGTAGNMFSNETETDQTNDTNFDTLANSSILTKRNVSNGAIVSCDFCATYIQNGFKRAWTWIDATLYSYLPFLIITVLNVVILVNLRGATKRRASLVGTWHVNTSKLKVRDQRSSLASSYWKNLFNSQRSKSRTCIFCPQSIPLAQIQYGSDTESSQRSENPNHPSPKQRISSSSQLLQRIPSGRSVNFKFVNVNGMEVRTVSVTRRARTTPPGEMRQLTILLLLLSGTFLLTTAPVVVVKLIIEWAEFSDIKNITRVELFDCIAEMLMYVNHAANFYLYFAVGTRFRRELHKMLTCSSSRQQKHRRRNALS